MQSNFKNKVFPDNISNSMWNAEAQVKAKRGGSACSAALLLPALQVIFCAFPQIGNYIDMYAGDT